MHCQTSSEEAMVIGPTCGVVLITTGNTRDIKSASSTFGKHQLGRLPRAWTRRRGWTRGDAGGWLPRFKMTAGGRVGPDRIHSNSPPLSSHLNPPSLASRSLRYAAVALCTSMCVLLPLPFLFLARGAGKNATRNKGFLHSRLEPPPDGSGKRVYGERDFECTGGKIRKCCGKRSGRRGGVVGVVWGTGRRAAWATEASRL